MADCAHQHDHCFRSIDCVRWVNELTSGSRSYQKIIWFRSSTAALSCFMKDGISSEAFVGSIALPARLGETGKKSDAEMHSEMEY